MTLRRTICSMRFTRTGSADALPVLSGAPGHVLKGPGVAVGVGEVGVVDAAQVLNRADLDTAPDQLRTSCLDIGHHEVQTSQGSGRHVEGRQPLGQSDRAKRPWRGEL